MGIHFLGIFFFFSPYQINTDNIFYYCHVVTTNLSKRYFEAYKALRFLRN